MHEAGNPMDMDELVHGQHGSAIDLACNPLGYFIEGFQKPIRQNINIYTFAENG